jgi:GTP-binding protein
VQGFIDETRLELFSGNGGPGCISFRKEKYVEFGGPNGGDGGRGGDVVFQIKRNLKTFSHLNAKHTFRAKNGQQGMGKKMHGKDGEDIIINIPPGTIIRDYESNEVLKDFADSEEGESWTFLKGGKGGLGNWHYRTSVRQVPRYAQPGIPGQSAEILLELNMIADVGFVGFPNAGKSSLLSALTNADPKVGAYPFTTKIPNLGMLRIGHKEVVLADIPGIIEGASQGAGLGIRFLKHIARTAGLAFMVDLSDPDFLNAFEHLKVELENFEASLLRKNRIIIATKTDLEGTDETLAQLREKYPEEKIIAISVFARTGLEEVKTSLLNMAH